MQVVQRSNVFFFTILLKKKTQLTSGVRKTRLLEMCENVTIINKIKKDLSRITSHILVITSVNQTGQGEGK